MKLKVRGASYQVTFHQEKNDLPNLVLLHGFLGSGKVFDPLISELCKFVNPITIDLLGHGESEAPELYYRYSSKEQIADLSKLISEQIQYPLYLLGYSMGGRLAFQLAFSRPDLFKGLIVESSTFGIENETERQARQSLDAERADSIIGNFEGFLNEWEKMPLFNSGTASDSAKENYHKIAARQDAIAMSNSLLGFGTGTMPCFKDLLKEIAIPVQLIVGEKDFKFIHINQAIKSEIEYSILEIVSNASHRVHLDNPSDYIRAINQFINHTQQNELENR